MPEIPSGPINIQAELDKWLAANPEAQKYVSKIWYVSEGDPLPPDVTHQVRLNSVISAERALTLGVVCTPQTAVFVDMLLAMIATNPTGA